MKQLQLTIKALSPLAIGQKKPGSVSEALDYIPGSAIRGAIAAQILQQSGQHAADLTQNGGDFQALFLSERSAIFQNAYPAPKDSQNSAMVLPSTAISCKNYSGFESDRDSDKDKKPHGVFDTLIDRFCAECYNHPYDPHCPHETCQKDKGRVEPYSGFYSKQDKTYKSHSASKRLLARVGINRSRATAEEEILYTLEVLSEAQGKAKQPAIYRSSIWVEDNARADVLVQFINSHTFRLGGSTSRGMGKVEIQVTALKPQTTLPSRIQAFNEKLQQRWDMWKIFGKPQQEWRKERTYFTLDLQSDAILTEDWQRTTVISPAMLCQFAGLDDASLELHVAYTSYDYRSGWNAAWGLMKNVDLTTNKGGVYLFSTAQPKPWEKALERLEIRGIGERTAEGFGQIHVCNEFHLVFREKAV